MGKALFISNADYARLCRLSSDIHVLAQDWYVEAASGDKEWKVLSAQDEEGRVVAALPLQFTRKLGFSAVLLPFLTQKNHIWTHPEVDRLYAIGLLLRNLKELIRLRRILIVLFADELTPDEQILFLQFGFSLRQRTTYRIAPTDDFVKKMKRGKKYKIHRADSLFTLSETADCQRFYAFLAENLASRGHQVIFPSAVFCAIASQSIAHDSGRLLVAQDADGKWAAGLFVVYDEHSLYYIMSTYSATYSRLGALEWLSFQTIKMAQSMNLTFDFEGSDDPNIAIAYSRFGSEPHTYTSAQWYAAPIIRWLVGKK